MRASYAAGSRNWNNGAPVVAPHLPTMNVSEGAALAIEATTDDAQATGFYATPAAVHASNAALTGVGSVVRLYQVADTITVPRNPDPNAFDATPKTLHRVRPARHVPDNHPSAAAGQLLSGLFGVSNCDDVVGKIIGPAKRAVVVGTGVNREEARYEDLELEPIDQIAGFIGGHSRTHDVSGLAAAASGPRSQGIDQAAQTSYQTEIRTHGQAHAALGLNKQAAPKVGEAFFISSLADDNRTLRESTAFATGPRP